MTRSMSLTLLLMAGSVAAAVAAPDLGLKSDPDDCLEMRAIASTAWSAAPAPAKRPLAVPVAAGLPAEVSVSPCALDGSEQYRLWHHGSTKLVAGCGALSST